MIDLTPIRRAALLVAVAALSASVGRGASSVVIDDLINTAFYGHAVRNDQDRLTQVLERLDEASGSFVSVPGLLNYFLEEPRYEVVDLTYVAQLRGSHFVSTVKLATGGERMFASTAPAALPNNASGGARNISRDGQTIVGHVDSGFFTLYHAFRWTQPTGIVDLDPLKSASRSSFAHDVSSDGAVVVGHTSESGGVGYAFRWTEAEGLVTLGTAAGTDPGERSFAYGVSGDGSVVVGASSFPPPVPLSLPPQRPFRWTSAGAATNGVRPSIVVFLRAAAC